jgi:thiamine biosynthesis lipoprotein
MTSKVLPVGRVVAGRTFVAMGTTVHLIGVGARGSDSDTEAQLEIAEARVHRLEAQWSRFRPTSELTRINACAGTPTTVTRETFDLIAAAVDGWHRTNGLFDPTLLAAVERVGYDRSFDELPADRPELAAASAHTVRSASCGDLELDADACTVCLPRGMRLDLGGIAKGYTADLVAAELTAAGLDGVGANLGGDVRVRGTAPDGGAWTVDVQDPTSTSTALALLEIDDGAIVTSTRLRRRWLVDGVEHHHLIDPRTRRSAFNGWAQVSVVAATATEAEVLAKAVFLAGPAHDLLDASGARAVLVADDGNVATIGFERPVGRRSATV